MNISERPKGENARDYAYRVLKDAIISLELEPGSQISENIISNKLGISRTPVREALIELSKLKMVEVYPQKGSFISKIDYDIVEETRFLRLTLEKEIVRINCNLEDRSYTKILRENIDLQKYYLTQRNAEKLLELDNQFHEGLFEMANKKYIHTLIKSSMAHFDRLRHLSIKGAKEIKTVSDHEAILASIEQGNEKKAISNMEKHLTRHIFEEKELRSKFSEYFK